MAHAIAFYTLSALILGFAVLVITARSSVHSVLFLVVDFLFVAALYVLLGAQFVAIIQVIVYAGGIVVLYLFVVMLVNLKRPAEAHRDKRRLAWLGVTLAVVVLVEIAGIALYGYVAPAPIQAAQAPATGGNIEQVGLMLYTDYLVPFEVASMLLLVAMVGAIVLARRNL
jgi:NADH-quinone oxidoreductase subunit J